MAGETQKVQFSMRSLSHSARSLSNISNVPFSAINLGAHMTALGRWLSSS